MNKKFYKIISTELRDTRAYDSYFNKFNHFSLTFNLLTTKEGALHCSHEPLRTKQTHTYAYHEIIQDHYITNTPSRNLQHRFTIFNSKNTSPYFLNFTYCIKNTNMQGIIPNYDPIRQTYIFVYSAH